MILVSTNSEWSKKNWGSYIAVSKSWLETQTKKIE